MSLQGCVLRTRTILFAAVVLVQVKSAFASRHVVSRDTEEHNIRLPKGYKPVNYDLEIKTYLPGYVQFPAEKNFTFEGKVIITIESKIWTRQLYLHAKHLDIQQEGVSVFVGGRSLQVEGVFVLKEEEKVLIELVEVVPGGQMIVLQISYTGLINGNLGGLYQSKYKQKEIEKISAITQFAPTDARQMVPCFDAPEYKSTWRITVIHPKGTTAISNGIEIGQKSVDRDFVSTEFKRTPRMSSYIVAVSISEFSYVERRTSSGIRFRVWSRPEARSQTLYALNSGVKCLEYYERRFQIKYPLEKLDMIAVPDFSFGAMENWGLITFRENRLLFDPKTSSSIHKRIIAETIGHELAHQWFGNLVTMDWWDDVWLKEGFSTHVQYIGGDYISNGIFQMSNVFLDRSFNLGLSADNKASSHPLTTRIEKENQISEIYDTIAYQKGASILRMIQLVMTERLFNNGVNYYLRTYAYNNARAIDLWRALDRATFRRSIMGPNRRRLNLTDFALQWTTQMGFPYVTLRRLNSTTVELSQKRYKENPTAREDARYANPQYGFKWDIPIWYQSGRQQHFVWLPKESSIRISSNYSPIVLNSGSRAFIRQNYEAAEWRKIFQQMNSNHLIYDIPTRHAIVSDAFAMVKIGELSYDLLFDLLDYRKKEKSYFVSKVLRDGLKDIQSFFGNSFEVKYLKEYILRSTTPLYAPRTVQKLSSPNYPDSKLYQVLELQNTFKEQCLAGSRSCKSELLRQFYYKVHQRCKRRTKTSDCVRVTPSLRSMVYCEGVKFGNRGTFEKIMEFLKKETVQQEKLYLLRGLTCTTDVSLIQKILQLTLDRSSGTIRMQDVLDTFSSLSQNDIAKDIMLEFLMTEWNRIYESFNSNTVIMTNVIRCCTKHIRTRQQIYKLQTFINKAEHARDFHEMNKMLEVAHSRVDWIERNLRKVTEIVKRRIQS